MKKLIIIAILMLATFEISVAQEAESPAAMNKNSIYGTVGFLGLGGALNINYERQLLTSNFSLARHISARVGYGGLNVWDTQEDTYVGAIHFLSGKKNNHLETHIGMTIYDTAIGVNTGLAGGVGYRYQKPTGHFIFRTGIEAPSGIYMSFGVAF